MSIVVTARDDEVVVRGVAVVVEPGPGRDEPEAVAAVGARERDPSVPGDARFEPLARARKAIAFEYLPTIAPRLNDFGATSGEGPCLGGEQQERCALR